MPDENIPPTYIDALAQSARETTTMVTGLHALVMFVQERPEEFKAWMDALVQNNVPGPHDELMTLDHYIDMLADLHRFVDRVDARNELNEAMTKAIVHDTTRPFN